jgi:hypothetical protein
MKNKSNKEKRRLYTGLQKSTISNWLIIRLNVSLAGASKTSSLAQFSMP